MTAFAYCRSNNLLPEKRLRWSVLLLVFWATLVAAGEWPESLQLHGFASQGYTLTSANNFWGDSSDDGTFQPTELGLNASWRPLNDLQLSAQMLSRRAGQNDEGEPRLDYGFVDYGIFSTGTDRFGLRLGRVKNYIGLYNETRDVVFTRPTILLPQSLYFDTFRRLQLSGDGFHLYGERRTGWGEFSFKAGIGYPLVEDKVMKEFIFGTDLPGHFQSKMTYIGQLLYESNSSTWRVALSGFQSNFDYQPDALPPVDLTHGALRFQAGIISLQYNAERWSLTSEFGLRSTRTDDFGTPFDATITSQFYYIQGSYRLAEDWEAVLRYDVLYLDKDDKNGHQFAEQDPFGRPDYSRFAKDWAIGLNWNINSNWILRAEYDRVNGTAWLNPLDNPNPVDTQQHWNMFIFMGGYRF